MLNEKKANAWSLIQNGQLNAARKLCNELCNSNKYDPQSWYMLSVTLSQLKIYPAAIKSYIKTLKLSPNSIEANYNLALTYQLSGIYYDAIKFFRKTISLNPLLADAHFGLGNCLFSIGKHKQAAESYRTTLDLRPDFINAKINLGIMLQNLGDLDAAETTLLSAISQGGGALAYLHIGRLYQTRNEHQKSLNSFTKALEYDPNLIDALHELAVIYFQSGHMSESQKYMEKILCLNNKHIDSLVGMGSIKILQGDHVEGLGFTNKALKLDKTNVNAKVLKAKTYEQMGKLDDALEVLRPIIDASISNAAAGAVFANICYSNKTYQKGITYLEALLKQDNLNNWEQRQILFSLGKLYDAAGRYDDAFSHYKTGNDLKYCQYSPSYNTSYTDKIINTFPSHYFEILSRSEHRSKRPIFIVGMPRSGTSLVEQILSRHPEITGGGELTFMYDIASHMQTQEPPYPDCLKYKTHDELNQLADEYLEKTAELHTDKMLLTDKLPANFQHLGLISLLFPSAIIVHCKRNPIDTCLSCYFQDFVANELGFTYNLEHLVHYYKEYQRLMKHWEATLEIPVLKVNYEMLIENQEKISRELVAFCELEWDPCCLDFNKSNRFVRTVSYDQVRRPIYNSSVERWHNYEQLIEPLKQLIEK